MADEGIYTDKVYSRVCFVTWEDNYFYSFVRSEHKCGSTREDFIKAGWKYIGPGELTKWKS